MQTYDPFNPWLTCPGGGAPVRYPPPPAMDGKWLCLGPELQRAGCLIYSIGSNNEYSFEEEMLKVSCGGVSGACGTASHSRGETPPQNTKCDVHTFDCTVKGHALHPTRHHFHKIWCARREGAGFAQHASPPNTLALPTR